MAKEFPEEGEIVLCTVIKIMGTTVLVHLDDYGKEGVVATSEVAPGRIRNIRDYVTINKKIVCKILRIDKEKGHIDLSLRRVSQKDSREMLESYKKEKTAFLILKIILKEKAQSAAEKIKENYSLDEFLEKAKTEPSILDKFVSEEEAKQMLKLIQERIKEKKYSIKAILSISSTAGNGIQIIKEALLSAKNVTIAYLGAPNYSIISESANPKEAEKKLAEAIEIITNKITASGGKIAVKKD